MITTHKVLSREEQAHLVRLCRRTMSHGSDFRGPLMILLALECGLRASELLGLKIRDFNSKSQTLFIRSKKGSNARELPLKPSRSRELKKWILAHSGTSDLVQVNPEANIFPIGYHSFHRIWDLYRPNRTRKPHSLRHSFAMNLYARTQDIRVVQLALGHRSITNTMVYVDFYYSQTALRRLMHGRQTRPTVESAEDSF